MQQGQSSQATVTQQPAPVSDAEQEINIDLLRRLDEAAASNVTLSNLLRLTAQGEASESQVETLKLFIQELAEITASNSSYPPPNAAPYLSQQAPPVTIQDFDLIVQFSEDRLNQWLFPRGPVYFEEVTASSEDSTRAPDFLVHTCIPFNKAMLSPHSSPQIATIRLKSPPAALIDTLRRWVGSEDQMEQHRQRLERMVRGY